MAWSNSGSGAIEQKSSRRPAAVEMLPAARCANDAANFHARLAQFAGSRSMNEKRRAQAPGGGGGRTARPEMHCRRCGQPKSGLVCPWRDSGGGGGGEIPARSRRRDEPGRRARADGRTRLSSKQTRLATTRRRTTVQVNDEVEDEELGRHLPATSDDGQELTTRRSSTPDRRPPRYSTGSTPRDLCTADAEPFTKKRPRRRSGGHREGAVTLARRPPGARAALTRAAAHRSTRLAASGSRQPRARRPHTRG